MMDDMDDDMMDDMMMMMDGVSMEKTHLEHSHLTRACTEK